MVVYPVTSSSKGNCTYVEGNNKQAVLIDVGVGVKTISELLSIAGFSLKNVVAVFITHDHSDHVSGLLSLIRKCRNITVFGAEVTLKNLIRTGKLSVSTKMCAVDQFKSINVSDLEISSFKLSHDTACCLGFCVFCGGRKLAVCTDLGCVTPTVLNNLAGSNFVLLESNFDIAMLKKGPYPAFLKRRIASKYGHLSNIDAAKLVGWLVGSGVKRFLLGHLSQNNNEPELAKSTVVSSLLQLNFKNHEDYFLEVAPVKSLGRFYEV